LASVPWNEVTEVTVPLGLTGAGSAGEYRTVAMDGDNLVVGVRNNDQVATDAGAAYVFRRDNNGTVADLGDDKWSLTATLFGSATTPQASDLRTGDFFGEGVAIDGDWMIISADHPTELCCPGNPTPALGDGLGVAYVYHFETGEWQFKQTLVPNNRGGVQDRFGQARNVDIEGNLAIIGAGLDDNANGIDAGAVHVFRFNGDNWVETAKLISPAIDGGSSQLGWGHFGGSAALEGGEIVVGSTFADGVNTQSGAVYVFSEDQSTGQWHDTARPIASDGNTGDWFTGVAREGNTIVVGPQDADFDGTSSGAAYVFEKDTNGVWTQIVRLRSHDIEAGDKFGRTIAINSGTILIGATTGNGTVPNTGAVYAFERVGGQWTEVDQLFESDRTSGAAGFGDVIEIGAAREVVISSNGTNGGQVYVYAQDATRVTTAFQKTTSQKLADRKGNKLGVTTSTINVSDVGMILDLDVRLDITHTRVGDLSVVLKSPGGIQIPLFAQVGGSGDNFTTTILDGEAATPIASGSAPFTGRYRPTGDLTSLNDTNLQGTWQLIVSDSVSGTSGTLQGWSLRVRYQLPTATAANAIAGVADDVLDEFFDTDDRRIKGKTLRHWLR
jgi:subtilisin-like proprotein convertase family protein